MEADRGNHDTRCSSMPPYCFDGFIEKVFDTRSTTAQTTQYTPNKNGDGCSVVHEAIISHSPLDLSVLTDEDSGYGQTPSCRRSGSTGSIANSGPVNSDDTGGSGTSYRDELLHVMTEDLTDWLAHMYPTMANELDVDNFFERISDGVLLCHHATELHQRIVAWSGEARHDSNKRLSVGGVPVQVPNAQPVYQLRDTRRSSASMSFVSRVNVSNFLVWCRQLGMPDSVLFESEDLVCRKHPRNVAVCLLELARLGGRLGMHVPGLVQLEVEIDNELTTERELSNTSSCTECGMHGGASAATKQTSCNCSRNANTQTYEESQAFRMNNKHAISERRGANRAQQTNGKDKEKVERIRPVVDMRSLDEIVRDLLSQCTCKQTFPMIRVGEGRYLFGDKCTQIFVRILRNHVMVRVGGGWDTLNHFLSKYDECRKVNPPNCRLPSAPNPPTVDTSDPDKLLSSLTGPKSPEDSPIRAQGHLNAIRRSPIKEVPGHVTPDKEVKKQPDQPTPCKPLQCSTPFKPRPSRPNMNTSKSATTRNEGVRSPSNMNLVHRNTGSRDRVPSAGPTARRATMRSCLSNSMVSLQHVGQPTASRRRNSEQPTQSTTRRQPKEGFQSGNRVKASKCEATEGTPKCHKPLLPVSPDPDLFKRPPSLIPRPVQCHSSSRPLFTPCLNSARI